jgi:hypothetical protein
VTTGTIPGAIRRDVDLDGSLLTAGRRSKTKAGSGRQGNSQNSERRPLDPTRPVGDITSAWNALRDRCGVHCRFHDLGHTAATKMAEAGVPESTMLASFTHPSAHGAFNWGLNERMPHLLNTVAPSIERVIGGR